MSLFLGEDLTILDLALKGYDIIANALGSLGEKFKIFFFFNFYCFFKHNADLLT